MKSVAVYRDLTRFGGNRNISVLSSHLHPAVIVICNFNCLLGCERRDVDPPASCECTIDPSASVFHGTSLTPFWNIRRRIMDRDTRRVRLKLSSSSIVSKRILNQQPVASRGVPAVGKLVSTLQRL